MSFVFFIDLKQCCSATRVQRIFCIRIKNGNKWKAIDVEKGERSLNPRRGQPERSWQNAKAKAEGRTIRRGGMISTLAL